MKKIYILLVAALATLSATAQTYHNNQWYSVYSDETIRMETIAHGDLSGIFAPTAGTMNLNWNYEIWGGGLGNLYKSNTTHIYESSNGTAKDTEVGQLTDANKGDYTNSISISQDINYIYFDRPTGNTNTVNITHIDIPLKKHILFDSGDYGTSNAKSKDFGELVWGQASDAFAVNLRSFYTSGDITITSDIPEVFRINSIDNVNGLTYAVGANACASKNGTANEAGGSKLGKISNYNFQIFFCPQEAKDYSGVVTITDGTSTLTVNVSGKGQRKAQSIAWEINDSYKTTATIPVATVTSGLQVAYAFDKEGILSFNPETNSFTVIKDGTVKITASQDGNAAFIAAENMEKTVTIERVVPQINGLTASNIISGSKLAASELAAVEVVGDIAGSFGWKNPEEVLATGTHDNLIAVFTPENENWYTQVEIAVTVKVVPSYGSLIEMVCPGEKFEYVDGVEYAEGTHEVTIKNYLGGDSIVALTVSYYPEYSDITDGATVCPSELPYTWETETFTEAGSKTLTLKTTNGCDSIVTFTLNVLPTYNVTDEATICPSELPYTWETETFTEAGSKTLTLKTINGCDSIVTFTLNVLPTYNVTDEATICPSELPYTWETETFTESGSKTLTLKTTNGCDSIVTFTLNVLPTYNVTDEATICPSELPYTWETETFTEAGSKTLTLKTVNNCDSIVTFTLNVLPTYNVTDEATICPAALPYTWEGEEFTEAGVKTKTLKTVNDCDSIVTFSLHVNDAYEVTDGATICPSELPYTWESETFTEAGSKTVTLSSAAGCDSIVTFTLTVLPTYYIEETDEMYVGKQKEWQNQDLSTLPVGETELVVSYKSNAGCDSIHVLHLTVTGLPTTFGAETGYVCKGEEFAFLGENYKVGEHTITTTNFLGGDSIITLMVVELPTYYVELTEAITYGETYRRGEETLTLNAGEYTFTDSLLTLAGCDSVVVTTLIVNKAAQTIEWEVIENLEVYEGTQIPLTVQATSGLAVTFTLSNNELAVIENNVLTVLHAGELTITATQDGNENYLPAEPVAQKLTILMKTALLNVTADKDAAVKFLHNGHFYILHNGELYDLTGRKLQ